MKQPPLLCHLHSHLLAGETRSINYFTSGRVDCRGLKEAIRECIARTFKVATARRREGRGGAAVLHAAAAAAATGRKLIDYTGRVWWGIYSLYKPYTSHVLFHLLLAALGAAQPSGPMALSPTLRIDHVCELGPLLAAWPLCADPGNGDRVVSERQHILRQHPALQSCSSPTRAPPAPAEAPPGAPPPPLGP